jgi:hypothetical protein
MKKGPLGPFLVIILQFENYLLQNLLISLQCVHLLRFFIGYWILKRGWIFILAPFLFQEPDWK